MLKINRLNRKGNSVECLIDATRITGITEIQRDPITYYDDCGDVAKTEERESIFQVQFDGYREIYISKEDYEKLVAKLDVETL